jgi:hypothetical protein
MNDCPECQKLRDINNNLQQIIAIVKSDLASGEQRLDEFIANANDLLKKITTQAQEMGLYDSQRMKRLKELGFIGCLNDSGVTSQNYKELLGPDFPFGPIPHWIKCEDRLPEDNEYVLAFGENEIAVMQFRKTSDGRHKKVMGYFQNIERGEIIEATHWMPLPETPHE